MLGLYTKMIFNIKTQITKDLSHDSARQENYQVGYWCIKYRYRSQSEPYSKWQITSLVFLFSQTQQYWAEILGIRQGITCCILIIKISRHYIKGAKYEQTTEPCYIYHRYRIFLTDNDNVSKISVNSISRLIILKGKIISNIRASIDGWSSTNYHRCANQDTIREYYSEDLNINSSLTIRIKDGVMIDDLNGQNWIVLSEEAKSSMT